MKLSKRLNNISKRAKVVSDKPAYEKKEKSESGGTIYRYKEEHIKKRWQEKKDKLKKLEKDIGKVRNQYEKDLKSDDERTRAIAACIGVIDTTSIRVGNPKSVEEHDTYGATTLKVKHITFSGSQAKLKFVGKSNVKQDLTVEKSNVVSVLKELVKGKKKDDFVFEVDGKRIWDRAINRYLSDFGISAKDLRGFNANKLMKEELKKKDFKEALKDVADQIGHEESTLKNQYLDPELVEKNEKKEKKASISIRAQTPTLEKTIENISNQTQTKQQKPLVEGLPTPEPKTQEPEHTAQPIQIDPELMARLSQNVNNIRGDISNYPDLQNAWATLAPFLPAGAVLTSGWRSDNKQAKIILDYWLNKKWVDGREVRDNGNGFFLLNFPVEDVAGLKWWLSETRKPKPISGRLYRILNRAVEPLRQTMTSYKPSGVEFEPPEALQIAALGTSNHLKGQAMDVSGVSIDHIARAANYINNALGEYVRFDKTLKEPGQNAVHLVVAPGARRPDDLTLAAALENYPSMRVASISKRAELNKEDLDWVKSIKPGVSRMVAPTPKTDIITMRPDTKAKLRIKPGVRVNELVLSAWLSVRPFLPASAMLTSGFRTAEDQKIILRKNWIKLNGSDVPKEYWNDNRVWGNISKELIRNGYIVGPPWATSPYAHLKGTAFDVSGADLYDIEAAIKMVSDNSRIPVKFKKPIVESKNNAVHTGIVSATYDAEAIRAVLSGEKYASIKYASEEDSWREDLMASNPPEEIVKAFGLEKQAEHDFEDLLGFGLEDEPGDWFEKGPIFRWLDEEEEHDFERDDISETEAKKLSEEDPEQFFYRGLHKEFPDLEYKALESVIETSPQFFFVFRYGEREDEKFDGLMDKAAEGLALTNPRGFFYYHLHHKYPELGRGAVVYLVDKDPRSFGQLGLGKDYPDYEQAATDAINIYDPTKVDVREIEEKTASKHKDKVPGGLADKKDPKDFDPKQIEKGIKVEMEHTDDKDLAREIAMDHLTEDPKYYDALEKIEKHAISKRAKDKKPGRPNKKDKGAAHPPPKAWFEKMEKEIKKNSPDYSEERVAKTIGDIWYNNLSDEKRTEIYKRHGKKKSPNKTASISKRADDEDIFDLRPFYEAEDEKEAEKVREDFEKWQKYLAVKERYKELFDKYKDDPRWESLEKKIEKYWEHQFDPREIGRRPHFWEYPKKPKTFDDLAKEERLKEKRKEYWEQQKDFFGDIPFWKYPMSSRDNKEVVKKAKS